MSYYDNRQAKICDNQGLMNEMADNFLADKPKRTVYGNFRIEADKLTYQTETLESKWPNEDLLKNLPGGCFVKEIDGRQRLYKRESNTVAVKINGRAIGNASILGLVGRTVAYGNVQDNRKATKIQQILELRIPMIPFSVMDQANLDITKLKFIEEGAAQWIERKVEDTRYDYNTNKRVTKVKREKVHFTGEKLFEVEDTQFLFDIDRNEIKHGIFNPFLVKLPRKFKSISEAYQGLKPKPVIDAEAKGIEVLRQGEWFFIKSKAPKLKKLSNNEKQLSVASNNRFLDGGEFFKKLYSAKFLKALEAKLKLINESIPKPMRLSAGPNRPNNAEMGVTINKITYVTGKISHSGREHADLQLKGWYQAVPNTATTSFTITGDID